MNWGRGCDFEWVCGWQSWGKCEQALGGVHACVIPAQAGTQAVDAASAWRWMFGGAEAALVGCLGTVARRALEVAGSCLRRNDGKGAGMTERGRRDWWCQLVAFHPPPNLPPERGEG